MASNNESKAPRGSRTQQLFLDLANRRKLVRYLGSGLLIVVLGLIVLWIGLNVTTKAYSTEALVVGLGIVILVVGIIRILIGLIRPSIPEDLPPPVEQQPDTDSLFAHEGDAKE
jgi:hypothetical protein